MNGQHDSDDDTHLISASKQQKKVEIFPFGNCRICNDTATGVHYGVISCEGCKGFFKRCVTQDVYHRCVFDDNCVINVNTRNRCRSCRFNRCIEMGMSMDSIKMGRIPKKVRERALRKYQKSFKNQLKETAVLSNSNSDDSSNSPIESTNYDLSLLCLPTIFSSSISFPNHSLPFDYDSLMSEENVLTVSKYISSINEKSLVDYRQNLQMRYTKNVLHTMKYLFPKLCQPFLIYELDFELVSFFRFLRWKTLKFYWKHTVHLRELIEHMCGLIHLDIKEYSDMNTTDEQMWMEIQNSIAYSVQHLFNFAQDTVGLNELNSTDFQRLMDHRILEFWTILYYQLFYQNESYLMTPNGLQYTRHFMNKFIGKTTTDALHEVAQNLHDLNITSIEHSLLIPIVICQPDQQLIEPEIVHMIKHCYMYALYIQLCTTRTEDQAKVLFHRILKIIETINRLNELGQKNIGQIVLEEIR